MAKKKGGAYARLTVYFGVGGIVDAFCLSVFICLF